MSVAPIYYQLKTGDGTVVADHVRVAGSSWARFKGLMLVKELPEGQGLCLKPCNSIHMFFMRIALDVAFVDRSGVVVHALHSIKPWRMSKLVGRSAAAIELPAGTLKRHGVEKGMTLEMVELNP